MAENAANPNTEDQAAPSLNAMAQYTKDFSFENPNAPRSFQTPPNSAPDLSIQVNIDVNQVAEHDFEVELSLEGSAKIESDVLFAFDLKYAGVFRLQGIPEDNIHPVLYIECPRLLFPFARQIVADAVRNGGFPPLYIDPVDFLALYRQKAAEAQAAATERGDAPLAS